MWNKITTRHVVLSYKGKFPELDHKILPYQNNETPLFDPQMALRLKITLDYNNS